MFWNTTLGAVLASALLLTGIAVAPRGADATTRALGENETGGLYGGLSNYTCGFDPICISNSSCYGEPFATCASTTEEQPPNGGCNTSNCVTYSPGKSCFVSGSSKCIDVYGCQWNPYFMDCEVANGILRSRYTVGNCQN